MRKTIALAAALAAALYFPIPSYGAYVNSGKSDFATAASTACVPNGSGVTSGHSEVIFVQANSLTSVTISSTRVSSWTQDQNFGISGGKYYVWHGVAASSGAETITVSFTSGTGLIGSACGEYSQPSFDATAANVGGGTKSITTAAAGDLVCAGQSASGGVSLTSPWTQRQTIQFGGTAYNVMGDQATGSAGSYTCTPTGSTNNVVLESFTAGASTGHKHRSRIF